MSDFTNFRAVYDDLTDEVGRARYQFVADHLKNWFVQLDETPGVSEIVERLQNGLDFQSWYEEQKNSIRSVIGSGRLSYPVDREKALGMKLLLFRHFAEGKDDLWQIGFHFIGSSTNLNDLNQSAVEQIFMPMARELRRYLEVEVPKLEVIPASDRIVTVNHNSKDYTDADEAMAKLEKAIHEANDFDDPNEKEQREAEVSAARRLLKAAQVRLEPLASLLKPILVQFTTKVKDNLITAAAALASGALIALLGMGFKALLGL
jgi:hypothetical protein